MRLRKTLGHRRFGVRSWLLVPILVLVLVFGAAQTNLNHAWTHDVTADLIGQRANTVLQGISARLAERRRSKEIYARMLAEQPGVARALADGDAVALARVLVPLQGNLGLGRIAAFDLRGTELLGLGPTGDTAATPGLVEKALAGVTSSGISPGTDGLAVLAGTPVKGPGGIVGALVVGTTLSGRELNEVNDRNGVELALYSGDRLVSTTAEDLELLATLATRPSALDRYSFDRVLDPLGWVAAELDLPADGRLLALIPTGDVNRAIAQRDLMGFASTLVLLAAVTVVAGLLAYGINRPLRSAAAAAGAMMSGDYRRRVPASAISELNALADGVNHLADRVQQQLAQLSHQAFFDPLTGLPNRALFLDRLSHAMRRRARRERMAAVLFLDLDNFKVINDSLGHQAGDQLLTVVAQRVQQCLRDEDTAARLGGDEFTILLEETADVRQAIEVAERIGASIQQPIAVDGHEVFTTSSIGIVFDTRETDDPEELLRAADLAMYRAKAGGKARFEVFDQSMSTDAMARLSLETDLRWALERGEFRVFYQPIVLLESGAIGEVEALVRWEHPGRGLVPPSEFIPLAEETGLILPLGRWVLETACRQVRAWQVERASESPLVVSINLSARQFQHPKLIEEVAHALASTGLPPATLKLEITETVMMHDGDNTIQTLRELKALGVQLAIDDFGTGYSCLAYLKRFPIDILKIDRSFVRGLAHDAEDEAIVRTIIALARTMNLSVTGEGIETAEQLEELRELGCDRGQGYYFARPSEAETIHAMLVAADAPGNLPRSVAEQPAADGAGLNRAGSQ